jgi:hypothetical protein
VENRLLTSIRHREEDERDKSLFRVGQRVSAEIGGCRENRTEGVITAIHSLPTLTTYEVRFDGYRSHEGIETTYMAAGLTPLD